MSLVMLFYLFRFGGGWGAGGIHAQRSRAVACGATLTHSDWILWCDLFVGARLFFCFSQVAYNLVCIPRFGSLSFQAATTSQVSESGIETKRSLPLKNTQDWLLHHVIEMLGYEPASPCRGAAAPFFVCVFILYSLAHRTNAAFEVGRRRGTTRGKRCDLHVLAIEGRGLHCSKLS